jgi:hypothetical protein
MDISEVEIHGFTLNRWKEMYLESLNPKEMKAYIIAKNHLGSSFALEKSLGFVKFQVKMVNSMIEEKTRQQEAQPV